MTKRELLKPTEKHKQNFKKLKRNFVKKSDPYKKLLENHKKNIEEIIKIRLLENYYLKFNCLMRFLTLEKRKRIYSLNPQTLAVLMVIIMLHNDASRGGLPISRIINSLGKGFSRSAIGRSLDKLRELNIIQADKTKFDKKKQKRTTLKYKFMGWQKFFDNDYSNKNYKPQPTDPIYDKTMDSLLSPEDFKSGHLNRKNLNIGDNIKSECSTSIVDPTKIISKPKNEEFIPPEEIEPIVITEEEANFAAIPVDKYRDFSKFMPKKLRYEFWEINKKTGKIKDLITGKIYQSIVSVKLDKKHKVNGTVLEVLVENKTFGYDIRKRIELDEILYSSFTKPWGELNGIQFPHEEFKNPILRQTITKNEYLKAKKERYDR